jgi:formylglycine-generating enzyme required for sulfatase activity
VHEPLPANCIGTAYSPFIAVGSYPAGNGRWGHSGLAGSMHEWVLDWYAEDWYATTQTGCLDCANLTDASRRVIRGGSWISLAQGLRAASGGDVSPAYRYNNLGWRCSRVSTTT